MWHLFVIDSNVSIQLDLHQGYYKILVHWLKCKNVCKIDCYTGLLSNDC